MKRSEINGIITRGKEFFDEMKFRLPPWAFWTPEEWKKHGKECREIVENMLGWDITDFGSGDFSRRGLFLFTLRNGKPGRGPKPYAEKIMIVEENQETPYHFHWQKAEDIINRGGGNLVIELYGSAADGSFSEEPVTVRIDGIERRVESGGTVVLTPGESICLEPGMYHRFFGENGRGTVLVGEVSAVNDDTTDNRFYEELGRFPDLVEDEEPLHLLVSDYRRYIAL
jgi:hypothetical protein